MLVVYYSQTGQLRQILDNVTSDLSQVADITFAQLRPVSPSPFPWTAHSFFDAMPETVPHLPASVQPLDQQLLNTDYDLIIFGYQPWFLNPSQPAMAFLQSDDAKLLKGRKVVYHNQRPRMWLHAQETVKKYFIDLGATLVGNIVLLDTNPNLVSLITIIRWSFTGRKEATRRFPEAGVV